MSALESLKQFEAAFDAWYLESPVACQLLDACRANPTRENTDQLLRLQNLIVASINARTVIKSADATTNF